MKHILFALSISIISLGSNASEYPRSYCQQRVYAVNDGPALLVRIGSGCSDNLVIGYKKSGILAKDENHELDAIVIGTCSKSSAKQVTVVKLGKEWHGTGYMNAPEFTTSFLPPTCYGDPLQKIAVAFTDGRGNWDSRYGENYSATSEDFNNAGPILSQNYGPYLGLDTWNIIINEMRK